MAPTGTMPPGGMYGQPMAPTATGPQGPVPTVGPGAFGQRQPMAHAPTAQLSGPERRQQMSRALLEMNRNTGPQNSGPSVAPPPEKPFAGFRPSSGVSPYMNLFRVQGDSLDNYTSLVRPQIEQRFLNSQFGHDIGGLQTRVQQVNPQQLYRTNETLQGVATPQYYMNTARLLSAAGATADGAVVASAYCGRITSESMYFRSDLTTPSNCGKSTGLVR